MKGKILKYSFMIAICFAFVFCFMPKQSLAANNDWIYDENIKTLTNEDGVILNNVTLSNGNELTIGYNRDNSDLTTIDLTGNIQDESGNNKYSIISIGDFSFHICSSLTNITLPEGVAEIGSSAFFDCASLAEITIPNSVTTIGASAFKNCTSLTNITIPEGVTEIGGSAFTGCT